MCLFAAALFVCAALSANKDEIKVLFLLLLAFIFLPAVYQTIQSAAATKFQHPAAA
jgi:hypothetical protein